MDNVLDDISATLDAIKLLLEAQTKLNERMLKTLERIEAEQTLVRMEAEEG